MATPEQGASTTWNDRRHALRQQRAAIFTGEALERTAGDDHRRKVTLVWDPADVAGVVESYMRPEDDVVEPARRTACSADLTQPGPAR